MPRIFHLIKSLGRGGAETLLAEGYRFSDRTRYSHKYGFFLPWKNEMVEELRSQGADVVCFDHGMSVTILLSVMEVARALRVWKADLIHCHLPLTGVVGRIAGRIANVPVVYTEHNRMERYHALTRRVNLLTWHLQDRVFAVSEEVASSIRRFKDDEVPIQVLLNGIDVDRFCTDQQLDVREAIGIPHDAPVVGTVAVFRKEKALHHWLEAARQIHDTHPQAHFLLVGDGPLRDELVGLAQRLEIDEVAHFPGLQSDVRPYLSTMDVFLSSSRFEGLPLALLEAMAMKRPVVATAVGGVPEVVKDGLNGRLAPPDRPGVLAERVSGLLNDRVAREEMGRKARETVADRYGLPRMIEELEAAYMEVLEQFNDDR